MRIPLADARGSEIIRLISVIIMANTREALTKLLAKLGESTQFAASGSLTPVLPGLHVEGVGSIGTPVSPADAKLLIA